jgi:hypothetical protein
MMSDLKKHTERQFKRNVQTAVSIWKLGWSTTGDHINKGDMVCSMINNDFPLGARYSYTTRGNVATALPNQPK